MVIVMEVLMPDFKLSGYSFVIRYGYIKGVDLPGRSNDVHESNNGRVYGI
jgi:hypothetical protein